MARFRRTIRHAAVAALGFAAWGGQAVPSVAQPRLDRSWQRVTCPFDSTKALLPVTCGRLTVPENHDAPGRSIEIAFMIVAPRQAMDSEYPVLFLSGGPGAPSLAYVEMLVATPQVLEVVVDRPWVFFDQRGLGRSLPVLRCPRGQDYFRRVETCRDTLTRSGVDLSQYNSASAARDVEALRKAIGARQWNLWGISYGSRLAFAVARDFPASVRSIIHDAPSDPESREIVDDFRGTESAIQRLLSKCEADAACSARYPNLRSRFLAALPRLRQEPLAAGDERITANRLIDYIRGYLFGGSPALLERRVQGLLAAMDAAARRDGAALRLIMSNMPEEAGDEPPVPVEGWYSMGQNLSVECNEERSFESLEEYRRAAAGSEIVRALFGEDGGQSGLRVCALWPAGRADPVRKTPVQYDGPQLVFSGELDASLSGLSGDRVARLYPRARHVVFRNAVHGQVHLADFPPKTVDDYRQCALTLARRFLADPQQPLDSRCAETRALRLVP